jgi:hypothetical protein
VEKNLLRLHVAVDDTALVRVVERVCDPAGDPKRLVERQLPFPLEPFTQRFTLDVRGDVVDAAVGHSGVDERQDVGMLESRRRRDLRDELLGAQCRRQLRP